MSDFIPPAPNAASPFADMRGHHVAVRTPNLEDAKAFYVGLLDFRIVAEWAYGDESSPARARRRRRSMLTRLW